MIQSCPHCGFINGNADEHTIFCPNCGEPYPVMREMTVQAPRMPTNDSGASSPFAPYGTSPYATPYAQTGRSGAVPPPPPGISGARTAATPRRRGGMGSFIGGALVGLGLILVVMTVLAAAALARNNNGVVAQVATATPSPAPVRPTATALPPTATTVSLTSYQDPAQRFSVQYPANWTPNVSTTNQEDNLPAYVTTFRNSSAPPQLFEVLVTPQRLSNSSLSAFVQASGGTNFQQLGDTTSAKYAGADWKVVTGTFISSNGVPLTARMLYTRHNGITTYALFVVTSQDQFNALNQKTFTPMLQSFAFGNNPA